MGSSNFGNDDYALFDFGEANDGVEITTTEFDEFSQANVFERDQESNDGASSGWYNSPNTEPLTSVQHNPNDLPTDEFDLLDEDTGAMLTVAERLEKDGNPTEYIYVYGYKILLPNKSVMVYGRHIKGPMLLVEQEAPVGVGLPRNGMLNELFVGALRTSLPCSDHDPRIPHSDFSGLHNTTSKINHQNQNTYGAMDYRVRGAFLDWLSCDNRLEMKGVPETLVRARFVMLSIMFSVISRREKELGSPVAIWFYQSIFDELLALQAMCFEGNALHSNISRAISAIYLYEPQLQRERHLVKDANRSSLVQYEVGIEFKQENVITTSLFKRLLDNAGFDRKKTEALENKSLYLDIAGALFNDRFPDGAEVPSERRIMNQNFFFHPPHIYEQSVFRVNLVEKRGLKHWKDFQSVRLNALLSGISDNAIQLLRIYHKNVTGQRWTKTSLAATLSLPKEVLIHPDIYNSKLKSLYSEIEDAVNKQGGFLFMPVHRFLDIAIGDNEGEKRKFYKADRGVATRFIETYPFLCLPDANFIKENLTLETDILITNIPKPSNAIPPSCDFSKMSDAIRVAGLFNAIINDADAMMEVIMNKAEKIIKDEKEREIIQAVAITFLKGNHPKIGAKNFVQCQFHGQEEWLFHFIADILMSAGDLDKKQINSAQRMLKRIELDQFDLITALHHSKAGTVKTVTQSEGGFSLDMGLIDRFKEDTIKSQKLLSEVFETEETASATSEEVEVDHDTISIESETSEAPKSAIPGLKTPLTKLLLALTSTNETEWTENAFSSLCQQSGLMASGAIEEINEWCFDQTGYPLLEEDGDTISADEETLEELNLSQYN